MELNLFIIGILLFIIFSLAQIIGFRFFKIKEIFSWLMNIAIVVGVGGCLFYLLVSILFNFSIFNSVINSVGIFLIYGWLVVLYVFGWFVILESSITIRLLYEIGKNNNIVGA